MTYPSPDDSWSDDQSSGVVVVAADAVAAGADAAAVDDFALHHVFPSVCRA